MGSMMSLLGGFEASNFVSSFELSPIAIAIQGPVPLKDLIITTRGGRVVNT
jgi:hypothetical protein